jgi:hypothetical protein
VRQVGPNVPGGAAVSAFCDTSRQAEADQEADPPSEVIDVRDNPQNTG